MTSKVISEEITLAYGRNTIDFINGVVTNQSTNPPTVSQFAHGSGKKKYMQKIRSLFIYVEADVRAEFSNAEVEFDMMSFNKVMHNIDLETLDIVIDTTFVPNEVKVIFVASDNPYFDYQVSNARPHQFYSNQVIAVQASWTDLFFRHTILDKFKATVFNDNALAKDIEVDIQHREMPEDDTEDDWVSYDNFPDDVVAGNVFSFGDDALTDTRHHFHRVRVKAKNVGETSTVDGSMLNI